MTEHPIPEPVPAGFKPCGCGVLIGEVCDCADWAAQVNAAFSSPLALVYEEGTYRWDR